MASNGSPPQKHDPIHGSRKLQVTILASEWASTKGGLSTINRELAIQLAKFSNVEVTFFLPKCSHEDKKAAASHGVSILEAVRRPGFFELDLLSFPPENLRIDVVVGHGFKFGRQAQLIQEFHRCKWVLIVHDDPEELEMYKYLITKGERKYRNELELCQMADFVVAVGPKLTEAFRRDLRWCKKESDIFEFTPGVFADFSSVQPVTVKRKQCNVLVFGHGDPEDFELKGFDIAARSVAALSDTCLYFVGVPHGEHEKIANHFVDLGIPKHRQNMRSYLYIQEDLKRLFCEVDLVLMPSRTSAFGLTGLEGLSAGIPVLVSKNSGFGEALSSVRFGSYYVIDSEDPSAWRKAIKDIWDKDRKQQLEEVKDVRDSYAKRYSWSAQCKGLIEEMFKLVDGSSPHVLSKRKAGINEKNESEQLADPGSSVPAEIRARGPRAEHAFQKAMQTGKVKVYRGRIMLLGQDRAGKTSLRKSLLGLPFDPEQESTVGIEVDEVKNWMLCKKGEVSELKDEIARFIVRDLNKHEADDNGSTYPNVEKVKTTGQLEEKKGHEKPKLSADGDELGTDTEEVEDGHQALSGENLVDKNDAQLNINLDDVTDLVVRYLQSRTEDDIKSEEVILTLWDFAGQHLYYASHPVFLSGRAVYILEYNLKKDLLATADPCVKQGVHKIRLDNANNETNLDNLLSWLVSVHNIRSADNKNVAHQGKKLPYLQPPVIIVGTHLDQPFEEVNTMEEPIKKSFANKEYEQHVTVPFFAVDNETENDEGVKTLRQRIIKILKEEPHMGKEVPLRWFKFEKAVDALVALQTYFMDLDQLLSVIQQVCQIEDEEEVTAMLNFYHDLGEIVKHGRTVVLQAQWLIDLFKQLITVRPFDEADPSYRKWWRDLEVNGILRIALVDHVFSKFIDKGLCKQDILDMMELHGLIAKFSIATDENQDELRYFVPTQLRSSPSALCEIKPSGCDPCPLVLHFLDGFVPHGLFPQLVSKFIHWCSENGLKETPQLFNNGARLFIGKQITFALILICRKRFIKIVLKTRNPSSCKSQSMNASNKMAIEVRNFIERTLDGFSRDLSWLSNLWYELSVVCTYCLECTRDLHKKTSCDQDDCLHLLRVGPGKELICLKNFCDETVSPGWEMWFEVPHTQTMEPEEDTQIADGTSSEPETTIQRVKATKRKRNKNFTRTSSEPETTTQRVKATKRKRKRNENFTGTSSEPETTTQRVKATKRKRNENFTGFSSRFARKKKRRIFEKSKSEQPAGTSEPETTAQGVQARKRKRNKNFTGHSARVPSKR
ncbi:uncharacterized protein [Acropora muricata]|uniref:uncharacterized protein isoform X2 n=1 Tax=Acropora muricata TaxID=159855 RepID=UPI0034E427B1